jgi:hypothetical protein
MAGKLVDVAELGTLSSRSCRQCCRGSRLRFERGDPAGDRHLLIGGPEFEGHVESRADADLQLDIFTDEFFEAGSLYLNRVLAWQEEGDGITAGIVGNGLGGGIDLGIDRLDFGSGNDGADR